MTNYASHLLSTQTEKDRKDQVKNNAGGYVFQLPAFDRLLRFLILGSDSNTYYQTARALTRENAQVVVECWDQDPERTLSLILEVSTNGRAPKNDPAIFALALGTISKDVKTRQAIYANMFKVCRTGTHIFQFIDVCRTLGKGWGRGIRNAISNWYAEQKIESLAYQMVKYRNRNNYSHQRLIDCSHPKFPEGDVARKALIRWGIEKDFEEKDAPVILQDFLQAQRLEKPDYELVSHLPWEALPTHWLNDARVWQSLLPGMGTTALIRNLGKMSSVGVLKALSKEEDFVVKRLTDKERLIKDRIHPMNILFALTTYSQGHGFRGGNEWEVNKSVVGALDQAFYLAFGGLPEGKKRTYIGMDVSGSMGGARIANSNLTARDAAAAMAMVTYKSEPRVVMKGFTSDRKYSNGRFTGGDGLTELDITKQAALRDVVNYIAKHPYGATDCALPILDAQERGYEVDQFVIYTDSETWAGKVQPYRALQDYRKKTGINAKLVVVGMTSTGFTIADPNDAGMLDVVGFDTAAPNLIAEF